MSSGMFRQKVEIIVREVLLDEIMGDQPFLGNLGLRDYGGGGGGR